METCTVNTCFTASKGDLSRGRGGGRTAATLGSLELGGCCTGGDCGPLLAQTQVTALLLRAASMLYLLGHPGFPQTLTPEARLPWGGGMQAWRTGALSHEGQ